MYAVRTVGPNRWTQRSADPVLHLSVSKPVAQTVRLEERLTAAVVQLKALRVQAQAESSLVSRYNLERSTALRLMHELSVQREAATGQASTAEMQAAYTIPRPL